MQFKPNKSWWLLGLGVLLGAGGAYAADARYDEADATVNKAIALLKAIDVPNEKPGSAWQRKRAIKTLERTKLRIACAKEAQDKGTRGCPQAIKDAFDDNDDDKPDHKDHHHKDKDKDKDKDHHHKDKDWHKDKKDGPAPKPKDGGKK